MKIVQIVISIKNLPLTQTKLLDYHLVPDLHSCGWAGEQVNSAWGGGYVQPTSPLEYGDVEDWGFFFSLSLLLPKKGSSQKKFFSLKLSFLSQSRPPPIEWSLAF